jgi:hypothetical protein
MAKKAKDDEAGVPPAPRLPPEGKVMAPEGQPDFALGPQPDAAVVVAADLIEANPTPAPETPYEIDADGTPKVPPRVPDLDPNWRTHPDADPGPGVEPTGPVDEEGNRLPLINRHSPEGARIMEMKRLWPVEYIPPEPEPEVQASERVDLRRR